MCQSSRWRKDKGALILCCMCVVSISTLIHIHVYVLESWNIFFPWYHSNTNAVLVCFPLLICRTVTWNEKQVWSHIFHQLLPHFPSWNPKKKKLLAEESRHCQREWKRQQWRISSGRRCVFVTALPYRSSDLALANRWAENLFPSAQTVVRVSVIEGLTIDLNYLDCLEKTEWRGGQF